MVIQPTTNNPPSFSGGGDGSNSALDFNSFFRLDMKTLSQSDLFSLSRSSPYAFDPKFDVTPNLDSGHTSTASTTTTAATHRRIFAFSHRRRPRRCNSGSDGDTQVTENKLILNSLDRLVDVDDKNPRVDDTNPREARKRKRKRKSKNANEFECCLGVIDVNGEVIDLRFLASDADEAFESELNRMTEGMEREDEFLGFLNGLEGRWGSTRRRRKYVDAAVFVKALPVNWKILLSLRPRVRRPSLYCRRFVSPSDEHFNSCKEVALYLKSQFVTNTANPREEGAMMHTDTTDCLETGATIPASSHPALEIDVSGTNKLDEVECSICKDPFTSTVGLESHLQKCHGNDIRLDMDALTRKRSGPRGLLLVREPKYQPPIIQNSAKQKTVVANEPLQENEMRPNELKNIDVNGEEGSSNEPENHSEGKRNFKTRCIWCLVEFFREPVDAETLASSCGFICPKCKQDVSWRFESALSVLTQHAADM